LSGADENPSVPRPDCDIELTADARIDDREDDSFVAEVGKRIGQEERPGADIEGRNAVRQIDHLALRSDLVDDSVADPHPLVAVAEVREEDDWGVMSAAPSAKSCAGPMQVQGLCACAPFCEAIGRLTLI
jgi:hypothetical protein